MRHRNHDPVARGFVAAGAPGTAAIDGRRQRDEAEAPNWAEIAALDDRMLADIGLTRADVRANQPINPILRLITELTRLRVPLW